MNRFPGDPAPYIPGQNTRFTWIDDNDPDVVRMRRDVAEGGHGLWMFGMEGSDARVVAEAYYPEDIRNEYYKNHLDRYRRHDYNMGRLVAITVIFIMPFSLDSCVYMTPPDGHGSVAPTTQRAGAGRAPPPPPSPPQP